MLCGVDVESVATVDDMAELGRALVALGARHVVVKGGHFARGRRHRDSRARRPGHGEGRVTVLDAARVDTPNDHGTGCSLSAAIAAGLALGRDVAGRGARRQVLRARRARRRGRAGASATATARSTT